MDKRCETCKYYDKHSSAVMGKCKKLERCFDVTFHCAFWDSSRPYFRCEVTDAITPQSHIYCVGDGRETLPYKMSFDQSDLVEWLNENALPLIIESLKND